jgi:hypothetical protein
MMDKLASRLHDGKLHGVRVPVPCLDDVHDGGG